MAQVINGPLPPLPPRKPEAHKGDFGTALIVGGSRGMSGAAALAGKSALRGGAGLVRVAVPDVCLETVAGLEPCYTTLSLPCDAVGRLSAASLCKVKMHSQAADAVAFGPGVGCSPELNRLAAALYREIGRPMVVDADGLNALSHHPEELPNHAGPRILTPHPGEFARLIGEKLDRQQAERAAVALAKQNDVVVVLKGHHSLITDGRQQAHNTTGNPGMATGGSGDVLTGLITALLGQHLKPFEAARLGAYLLGLAGDLAAEQLGQMSLTAKDLIEYLPQAFKKHGGT